MRVMSTFLLIGALAACGVDGEPVKPTGSVTVGPGGVSTSVGVQTGNVGVTIGL